MSTNVFNSSAMAAVAAAALGTGVSRHHHSAVGSQATMLFTPTPVAGTPLGMSSSPTAFPFPPPSPLFLPSLSLLQQSPQATHPHLQSLSPWMSPSPVSLSAFGMHINGKSFTDSKEFASDDNNNDLNASNAQNLMPSTPPKANYQSVENDISDSEVQSSRELKSYSNGMHELEKDNKPSSDSASTKSYSPSKPHATHCRPDNTNWAISETADSCANRGMSPQQMKLPINKLSDSASSKGTDGNPLGYKPPFLMPPYVGTSSSMASPTFPIGIRPPPPSPQTPTQHASFGSHYPHYLLPPSLYPYYHNQKAPSQSFSPTNHQSQNSPISPFLVPNLPQSASPSMISTVASNVCSLSGMPPSTPTSMFDVFAQNHEMHSDKNIENSGQEMDRTNENHSSHKSQSSQNRSSSLIDLTLERQRQESPVDCSKLQCVSPAKIETGESSGNLKRKDPSEEYSAESFKPTFLLGSSELNPSSSRKHRIMKPPNINISECDYRNGFGSSYLHSPLFGQHFAANMSSSPYTYLDHIPLSAPPIAPPHPSSSKFDFSGHTDYNFTSPQQLSASKDISLSHSLLDQYNSTSQLALTSSSGKSSSQSNKAEMPNSIMKDSKKKSSNGTNSECKVTFQVPHASRHEMDSYENQCKDKSFASPSSLKNKLNSVNSRKPCQKYPEYFRKGSTIKLGNGVLKKVEELSTEDFIESASANGKFKVELSEVLAIQERSKKSLVRITFLVGQSQSKVSLDSPIEHPFFVFQKGWCSCSPSTCSKRYGLNCQRLSKGDIVVTLASKPPNGTSAKSLSSQQLPRSLASSSSSLSSASSVSSTSSLTANTPTSNLYAASHLSLPKCPPPAHLNQPYYKSLLHSNHETALNLDTKSSRPHHKLATHNRQNHRYDDEEEIDVENVDDEGKTSSS